MDLIRWLLGRCPLEPFAAAGPIATVGPIAAGPEPDVAGVNLTPPAAGAEPVAVGAGLVVPARAVRRRWADRRRSPLGPNRCRRRGRRGKTSLRKGCAFWAGMPEFRTN